MVVLRGKPALSGSSTSMKALKGSKPSWKMADPKSRQELHNMNVQQLVTLNSKKLGKLLGSYQNNSGANLKRLSLAKDEVNRASIITSMN